MDQDIYKLTPEKRRELSVKELPGSLAEAVESVKSDSEFLSPIFPGDLLGVMMELEMENYRAVGARPHPYEFYLYFDLYRRVGLARQFFSSKECQPTRVPSHGLANLPSSAAGWTAPSGSLVPSDRPFEATSKPARALL